MKLLYKIFSILIITFLLTACATSEPKAKLYPHWYENVAVKASNSYEIVGYGYGSTVEEAKAKAKESIAQTIVSRVNSSFESSVDVNGDKTKVNQTSKLKITTKLNLHDLKLIKQERVANSFYVALLYKNLDLAHKIKLSLDDGCSDEKADLYMSQTSLFKTISLAVGCELNLKLSRQNSAWYLKHNEKQFLLSDDEFEELFVSLKNSNIEMQSSKNVLVDGDSFYFSFSSKESGFVTILDVYEIGIEIHSPSSKIYQSLSTSLSLKNIDDLLINSSSRAVLSILRV